MNDEMGQISLEYLLIVTIALIILIVFTLPLTELTIKNTLDISDNMNVKSDLSNIAHSIKTVYGEGQGSKQTINIVSSKDMTINVDNNHVSCNMKLKDGSSKIEREYYSSTLEKSKLNIKKGENTIIVEWPVSSENMIISSN